jgi:serine/threonine-protein kinase HipA
MTDVTVLEVLLHDDPIGTLTRVSGDRTLFAFHDAFARDAGRPTLSLGFHDEHGHLITSSKPFQKKVMPFFANLLPEGHMRTYLAERAGVNPERDFFLLGQLGADLPGAITVRPADGGAWPLGTPDGDPDGSSGDTQGTSRALRFSLAGVQLKFSAINDASGGLTIPAHGMGGSWIVKLPSSRFEGVPENEYSMMKLAGLIGIDVPETSLIPTDEIENLPEEMASAGQLAFVVERFDRPQAGGKIHVEDFAQIFRLFPAQKYDRASYVNIARVIAAECGDLDIAQLVRRLTFNVLIGNADMHVKNWSVMYPDRRNAALAPAYDLVSTISYIRDRGTALKMSRSKLFAEFSEDELSHFAARALLPKKLVLDTARETVLRFHEHWSAEKSQLPLRAEVVKAIDANLKLVPIA